MDIGNVAKSSFKGGFFLFVGMTSSTIIMALTSIIVARLLGPADYGLYTIVLVVPSFFINLSDLGISPALTRFSAHFRAKGENGKVIALIKTGILFKLLFSILISTLLFFLSDSLAVYVINRPNAGFLIRLTAFYLIGESMLESVSSTFIGLDDAKKSSLLMNIQAVIKAITAPILILIGFGIAGAIIGTSAGFVVAAALGVIILLFHICPKLQIDGKSNENLKFSQGLKMMTFYGVPLYLSALIGKLQSQISRILLAFFTSDINIGNYATAISFSILISLFAVPIATSLFPAFSKLTVEREQDSIEKMFKYSVKYTSLIIIPLSIGIAILSKDIVSTLYGSRFESAPFYLSLYMSSFLLTGIGMFVINALFNSQGDTKISFRLNLVNFALSIPLSLLTIPLYGVIGLIISLLISQLISTLYGLYLVKKRYKITVEVQSSGKIIISSLLAAILVYLSSKTVNFSNPIYGLTFGGALYLASFLIFAPLLKAINKEDLENLEFLIEELPLIAPILKWILIIEGKILGRMNFNF